MANFLADKSMKNNQKTVKQQKRSTWSNAVYTVRSGWVTDMCKVQNATNSLAATDDCQQADGFLHAQPQDEKGKRRRQKKGAHITPFNL